MHDCGFDEFERVSDFVNFFFAQLQKLIEISGGKCEKSYRSQGFGSGLILTGSGSKYQDEPDPDPTSQDKPDLDPDPDPDTSVLKIFHLFNDDFNKKMFFFTF